MGECWQIEEGALTMLRQLNSHPQLKLDVDAGDSYGLWGCLRAYNDEFAEILFRIQAEFLLEKGWLAPSQFTGYVVINRVEKKVPPSRCYVPEGTLNFDARWTREKENTYADIGYCPKMELCADTQPYDAKFNTLITQEEAERALILCFYKSEQINWVSLEEALEMARVQQKPIHSISINGPLADESC